MLGTILAATSGDVTKAGKAVGLALGVGLGAAGAGVGIGLIFSSMIQAVARQPELRGELTGIQWLGFALTEAVVFYGLLGSILPFVLVLMNLVASNPLIQITPGLMIWTIVCFLVTFYVLKKFAFGRIQGTIDERRKRIRAALDEADHARAEAQRLVEEHRAAMAQARGQAEEIPPEPPKASEPQKKRPPAD